uniref:Protein kinase domain-containing protein n=1 Tax=Arundo donax TaxID=35708 RepID=A0A0A9ACU6_ARUDO
MLDLSSNAFMATLPQSLLCSKTLNHLDVSNNNLSGQIPLSCPGEEESSSSLVFFNASSNHFSGSLDESISNFTQLSSLDIHNNSLTGSLPSALSNLNYLNYLDLSNNDFSGTLPCGICNISSITFANFSGNHIGMHSLSDCVASGVCAANSINQKRVHPPHVTLRAVAICAIALIIVIVLVLLVVCARWKLLRRSLALVPASQARANTEPTSSDELLAKKSCEPLSINPATFEHAPLRVTLDDILKATDNFSAAHIIGHGGFGTVDRAALPEGRRVANLRSRGFMVVISSVVTVNSWLRWRPSEW